MPPTTAPAHEQLPRREREILHALFALGNEASAEEIRTRLNPPPSYSAVRAMLARLERKGYVRHRQQGLKYVYFATTSPQIARRKALQQYLRTFFGGSRAQMLTALLRQESWTKEELDDLRAEIDRARTKRR